MSLINILNQNQTKNKIKVGAFIKKKIINENLKIFDFLKLIEFFKQNEDHFFDFIKIVFSNYKNNE